MTENINNYLNNVYTIGIVDSTILSIIAMLTAAAIITSMIKNKCHGSDGLVSILLVIYLMSMTIVYMLEIAHFALLISDLYKITTMMPTSVIYYSKTLLIMMTASILPILMTVFVYNNIQFPAKKVVTTTFSCFIVMFVCATLVLWSVSIIVTNYVNLVHAIYMGMLVVLLSVMILTVMVIKSQYAPGLSVMYKIYISPVFIVMNVAFLLFGIPHIIDIFVGLASMSIILYLE